MTCEADPADLSVVGRSREEPIGRYTFDVFPVPDDPDGSGAHNVRASMERRDTGQTDEMGRTAV